MLSLWGRWLILLQKYRHNGLPPVVMPLLRYSWCGNARAAANGTKDILKSDLRLYIIYKPDLKLYLIHKM
jgi:hypothetical protein